MATVTSKGQITIPKEIRDALGLAPGTQVEFDYHDGVAVLRKKVPTEALDRWRGYLRAKGERRRTDEIMKELRGG